MSQLAAIAEHNLEYSELEARVKSLTREAARRHCRSLHNFVAAAWPLVEPKHKFVDNWHIVEVCKVLEQVTRGELNRVVINVPPGMTKSLLLVLWRAWEWTSDLSLSYLAASYSDYLSLRDNARLRDVIVSNWYQQHWPLKLKDDQDAKGSFRNTAGGQSVATSVRGKGTGEHTDRVIIDDPTTADQARSDADRKAANDWFDQTIASRGITRGVAIVLVMQRLHEDDLTGHLLGKGADGGWEHVRFPMEWEPLKVDEQGNVKWTPDPRDPRTTPGELLWPSLFTPAKVKILKLDLGPYGTAGQLQQQPAPDGGGLFQRGWFKLVDAAPIDVAARVRGWDTGATDGGGDETAGVRVSLSHDGFVYIEHCVADSLGPAGVDALIHSIAGTDGKKVDIAEEREPGSAGKTVTDVRLRSFHGYNYKETIVSDDKVTRSRPFRAQCEAGNVFVVKGEWNAKWFDELTFFPVGKKKNRVDATTCAYNAAVLAPKKRRAGTW